MAGGSSLGSPWGGPSDEPARGVPDFCAGAEELGGGVDAQLEHTKASDPTSQTHVWFMTLTLTREAETDWLL